MGDEKVAEGWGWPGLSRKAHYFLMGRSLCGRWGYIGDLEQGKDKSPDNCAPCRRLLERRRERAAKAASA